MKTKHFLLLLSLAFVPAVRSAGNAQESVPLAQFTGPEFRGGGKDLAGTAFDGEQVNTLYAEPSGPRSTMQVSFSITNVPVVPLFIHLKARNDERPERCKIALLLNGATIFEGTNGFAPKKFATRRFTIPAGTLKTGENTLVIACREKTGKAGMPPWFQVAACTIAPETFVPWRDLHKDFYVTLPAERRPFPEPLPEGGLPGFKFRGTKGWAWRPEQYLAEIPWLAKFKMNFLMNCYLSMFDLEHHTNSEDGEANRWWEELPKEKKRAYEQVVRECQKNGIEFCFSMNPNLVSKRIVNDDSPGSIDALYKHYAWMQSLGVKWFNISLDDISSGINASTQAKVVNEILHRLRAKDSAAQMIFCPTYYWGDGTRKEQQPYLERLAGELDADVYLFWTGDSVVGKITRNAAEKFRRISGHRLFLWDNYPVNDNNPSMHLGPVVDRDSDLCRVLDGYMSNPHCKQNEINRLPLATCADYAYNPGAYDPARSIGQAILAVADTRARRAVLCDLVEAYPGMAIYSSWSTGFNCVQHQFDRITGAPHSRQAAIAYIDHLEHLSSRLEEQFPHKYEPAKQTLDEDIKLLKEKLTGKYTN
jgi:beta-N-acetylglucosaminidase